MAVLHSRLALLALLASLGSCPQAQAQTPVDIPSAAQRCLTLTDPTRDAAPEYPYVAFKWGVKGWVKVEMVFTQPDRAPEVKILDALAEGKPESLVTSADFVKAVTAFAVRYRVPCLVPSEGPARLSVEYLFRPEQLRPTLSDPVDLELLARAIELGRARAERQRSNLGDTVDSERIARPMEPGPIDHAAMRSCMAHLSGDVRMAYPTAAAQRGVQGRLHVRLRFTSPSQPPVATVTARDGASVLASALRKWVQGLRLPCLGDVPYETTKTYKFIFHGDAYGFKPGVAFMPLFQSMPSGIRQQMPPDTTAMGCPFDVTMTYWQPLLPNDVSTLGIAAPTAREPFLAWLRTVTFDLPAETLDSIFGDTVQFSIPCLKITPNP